MADDDSGSAPNRRPPPPSEGDELASLDFAQIIGGPLIACINAQAASAVTTVDFIKEIGFAVGKKGTKEEEKNKYVAPGQNTTDMGEAVNVTFTYTRTLPNGQHQPTSITVPFLTMVPIPTLRIAEAYVEFSAKITTTKTRDVKLVKSMQKTQQSLNTEGDTSDEAKPYQQMTTFVGNISNQRTDTVGNRLQREFSLLIKVKAVQDELPAGLDRILSLLEGAIRESSENPTTLPLGNQPLNTPKL
mmetsp:Transcript_43975/g.110843  ORF Transcript_43975/g.110843 Transcript_43975/m.110843 type:complete len:245 (+) Transcript_43975:174-908(+)|eukprot:CAMPEP_0177670042 /NCGR_PEP_ID=MMETSP0447-20121125/23848_1 /TAXON_ID=0 /ORGANISM="Stygamoeba regulata, Strain BSH-02190019" /LENGTH=244 /DNA_ID=CAMNT_0019177119 /DNA_START=112 /DNA_END=846 /DNA_ORIENTATION=-